MFILSVKPSSIAYTLGKVSSAKSVPPIATTYYEGKHKQRKQDPPPNSVIMMCPPRKKILAPPLLPSPTPQYICVMTNSGVWTRGSKARPHSTALCAVYAANETGITIKASRIFLAFARPPCSQSCNRPQGLSTSCVSMKLSLMVNPSKGFEIYLALRYMNSLI